MFKIKNKHGVNTNDNNIITTTIIKVEGTY